MSLVKKSHPIKESHNGWVLSMSLTQWMSYKINEDSLRDEAHSMNEAHNEWGLLKERVTQWTSVIHESHSMNESQHKWGFLHRIYMWSFTVTKESHNRWVLFMSLTPWMSHNINEASLMDEAHSMNEAQNEWGLLKERVTQSMSAIHESHSMNESQNKWGSLHGWVTK